jgi:hypothetical protein
MNLGICGNHITKEGSFIWFEKKKGNAFYSESDADAYGIRKVREWRANYGPKDITDLGGIDWNVFT